MQKTSLICNNFSGINRTTAVYSSSVVTASDIQNVELYSTGVNSGIGIRTAKGNVSICDSIPEDENIINIFESIQNRNTYFFVHTENEKEGKIYLFNLEAGTLTLKADKLTVTGKSSGCDVSQGWEDLFVFSNSEELLTIQINRFNASGEAEEVQRPELKDADGRTVKGLGIVVFAGRLWVFSNQILWYSVRENIYDFSTSDANLTTSAGYIEFVKKITAIYPYLGALAVFHKDSSCLITEENGVFSRTMDSPGGCAGYAALVFHGTELYFYDYTKKGIYCFRQIINGDKTLGENIALNIQEELCSIPLNQTDDIRTLSVVTSDRNEVWFLLPSFDNKYSTILIFDYVRSTWLKRKCPKINCFRVIGGVLYSAGKKIYEEYNSNNFDGTFIQSFYNCSPFNLLSENSRKIAYPPKFTLDLHYKNSFYIKYVKNYNETTTKTKYITAKTVGNYLHFDIGYWDNSYFPSHDLNTIKKLPVSSFKTLQMTFSTENEGDDFCIRNIEFEKIKVKTA